MLDFNYNLYFEGGGCHSGVDLVFQIIALLQNLTELQMAAHSPSGCSGREHHAATMFDCWCSLFEMLCTFLCQV